MAALALAPDDHDLRALVEDLGAAAAASASGATVRLKEDADRRQRLEAIDRLPKDLEALQQAYYRARERGEYRLILALAEHGLTLTLTRRTPYGVGSEWHLMFRGHWAEASERCGRYSEALAAVEVLLQDAEKIWGVEHPNTRSTRFLKAACLRKTGDAMAALAETTALQPLNEKVSGVEHPGTIAARQLKAICLRDTGERAAALEELAALLPLQEKVLGAEHPTTLTTRYYKASCLRGTGDAAAAQEELVALLPLKEKVKGVEHPDTLATRMLIGECLLDLGRIMDAEQAVSGVAERIAAKGLLPAHTLYRDLDSFNTALTKAKAAAAEPAAPESGPG